MARARRAGIGVFLAAAVTAAVTACSMLPSPAGIQLTLPARSEVRQLPVTVVDHADLVRDAAPAEIPADPAWETMVQAIDGRDDAVLLTWMGGACDDRAIVTVDPAGDRYQVTVKTETSASDCSAVGVFRAVLLTIATPVEPDEFEAVDDPQAR